MKTVHKSVLIWYSAAEMFALVTDIVSYPQFLPWCDQSAVLAQDKDGMTAKVGLSIAGLSQSFTTRNIEYVAEGGSLRVYDTTRDILLINDFVPQGTINIVGYVGQDALIL